MKIQSLIKTLYKPVHPIVTASAVIGVVLLAAVLLLTKYAGNNSSTRQPTLASSTPTTTLIPMPVDTSAWRTYTDWKYGYSIKLPPEFFSYIPGKGQTGSDPDPMGTGEMNFEDIQTMKLGDKYPFTVRTHNDNHLGINCTSDQDCYAALYNRYKTQPNSTIYPLRAKILQRDIRGLAIYLGSPSVFDTLSGDHLPHF